MLTITLSSELEKRLKDEAERAGLDPGAYAQRLIAENLHGRATQTLGDLFTEWETEDATDDPAELARRNAEFEEFKQNMNQNRIDSEGPGARVPFP